MSSWESWGPQRCLALSHLQPLGWMAGSQGRPADGGQDAGLGDRYPRVRARDTELGRRREIQSWEDREPEKLGNRLAEIKKERFRAGETEMWRWETETLEVQSWRDRDAEIGTGT